jgi:hypothetical protein
MLNLQFTATSCVGIWTPHRFVRKFALRLLDPSDHRSELVISLPKSAAYSCCTVINRSQRTSGPQTRQQVCAPTLNNSHGQCKQQQQQHGPQ